MATVSTDIDELKQATVNSLYNVICNNGACTNMQYCYSNNTISFNNQIYNVNCYISTSNKVSCITMANLPYAISWLRNPQKVGLCDITNSYLLDNTDKLPDDLRALLWNGSYSQGGLNSYVAECLSIINGSNNDYCIKLCNSGYSRNSLTKSIDKLSLNDTATVKADTSDTSKAVVSTTVGSSGYNVANATLTTCVPLSSFGDATVNDVIKGKSFTSSAGVKKEGCMVGFSDATSSYAVLSDETYDSTYDGFIASVNYEVCSKCKNCNAYLNLGDSYYVDIGKVCIPVSGICDTKFTDTSCTYTITPLNPIVNITHGYTNGGTVKMGTGANCIYGCHYVVWVSSSSCVFDYYKDTYSNDKDSITKNGSVELTNIGNSQYSGTISTSYNLKYILAPGKTFIKFRLYMSSDASSQTVEVQCCTGYNYYYYKLGCARETCSCNNGDYSMPTIIDGSINTIDISNNTTCPILVSDFSIDIAIKSSDKPFFQVGEGSTRYYYNYKMEFQSICSPLNSCWIAYYKQLEPRDNS